MRVAIIGAGSVGSFIGARLALSGVRVSLVGRQSLLEDVKKAGWQVSSRVLGGKVERVKANGEHLSVLLEGQEEASQAVREADVVMVTTKSLGTENAAKQVKDILAGNQFGRKSIVSVQNGVANPRILSQWLGEEHDVVPGLMEYNVTWGEGALFQQQSQGVILLETKGMHWKQLQESLIQSGLETKVENNLAPLQYGKLIINLNNSVNALSSKPLLQTLADDDFRKVLAASIYEAHRVFKEANIPVKFSKPALNYLPTVLSLPRFLFTFTMNRLFRISPDAKLSMLQDLEKNRLTEIDFINGEVVQVAERHGLKDAVVNKTIVQLIKTAEAEGPKPPFLSGADVRRECKL